MTTEEQIAAQVADIGRKVSRLILVIEGDSDADMTGMRTHVRAFGAKLDALAVQNAKEIADVRVDMAAMRRERDDEKLEERARFQGAQIGMFMAGVFGSGVGALFPKIVQLIGGIGGSP